MRSIPTLANLPPPEILAEVKPYYDGFITEALAVDAVFEKSLSEIKALFETRPQLLTVQYAGSDALVKSIWNHDKSVTPWIIEQMQKHNVSFDMPCSGNRAKKKGVWFKGDTVLDIALRSAAPAVVYSLLSAGASKLSDNMMDACLYGFLSNDFVIWLNSWNDVRDKETPSGDMWYKHPWVKNGLSCGALMRCMPFNAVALLSWQDEEGRRESLKELSADLRRISKLPYHPVADVWLDAARHKVFSNEFLQYALPAVKDVPGDWPWQVLTDWDNLKKPDKWFIREGRHQYGRYLRNMFLQFTASEERAVLDISGRLDEDLLLVKNPAGESFSRSYATFVQKLSAAQKNENLNMDDNPGVCFKQITEQLLREASWPLARSRVPKF